MAGAFYRVKNMSKNLSLIQIKDVLIKYGYMNPPLKKRSIVGDKLKGEIG